MAAASTYPKPKRPPRPQKVRCAHCQMPLGPDTVRFDVPVVGRPATFGGDLWHPSCLDGHLTRVELALQHELAALTLAVDTLAAA